MDVIFVCTGNICRSPLAEAAARALVPEGRFSSAGTAASNGSPASANAATVASEGGWDLSGHRARQATTEGLSAADLVLVMTDAQRGWVTRIAPEATVELLDPEGDMEDPYGLDLSSYRITRDRIVAAVRRRWNTQG